MSPFQRIASTDQRCSDTDLQLLYRENQSSSYDQTTVIEATLDDLDQNAIEAYRRARHESNPDAPELNYSDQDLLYSLNLITKHQDSYCPNIAGLILFGNKIALRRYCPLHRVDYISIEGTQWIKDDEDRYQTIEFREALLLAIPKLVTNVLQYLPTRFGLAEDSIQRHDIPLIPRKVIREAIVNAVMHRDYRQYSPIQIIQYSDRLEIRNPGYSLKLFNEETLGEPGSIIRNQAIAAVLHETGFAETKGSGIRVMLQVMLKANLSLPSFESNRNEDRFQVILYTHNLFDNEALQWLSQFKNHNLTDEEVKILVVLREKGRINNALCRLINDIDTLKASQRLKRLRDIGLIDSQGKGTATYYTLASKILSGQLENSNLDSSTDNQDSLSGQLTIDLFSQESLENRLKKVRQKKHYKEENRKDLIRDLILELCKIKPRSSSQLATLLNRKKKYLLEEYIKPLMNEKLLEYTIPERPNDPSQAYRTTQR